MILCCPTPDTTSIAGLEFKRVYKDGFISKIILCEYELWNTTTFIQCQKLAHFAKIIEFLPVLYNFRKEILVSKCLKSYLALQNRFIATENVHHSRITFTESQKRFFSNSRPLKKHHISDHWGLQTIKKLRMLCNRCIDKAKTLMPTIHYPENGDCLRKAEVFLSSPLPQQIQVFSSFKNIVVIQSI